MPITFTFRGKVVTYGAGAWSNRAYSDCQFEIRETVAASPFRDQLREWFESKTKLSLMVYFYLGKDRSDRNDLDNLLSTLFNPLVWGAWGARRPGPVQPDALFWKLTAIKVKDDDERVVIEIEPMSGPQ